jgi:SAM-dependent methyltransferase
MLERLSSLFGDLAKGATESLPEEEPVTDIGLIDMSFSGWLRNETGELLEGFAIDAQDSVLDIGCGSGGYTLFCGRQGAEIFVADINQANIDTAVSRLRETKARAVHPLVTDGDPIPLPDERLSKIIAMEVLEHVDDPARFMRELVRVGRPGAQYLIAVPDAAGEHAQKSFAAASYFQKPNHIHIFEREEFDRLIEDAGLIIERRVNYGFYRTLWMYFFWASAQPSLSAPWHPLIEQWDKTWSMLLSLPQGAQIKKALDEVLPKSQVIIARKPEISVIK